MSVAGRTSPDGAGVCMILLFYRQVIKSRAKEGCEQKMIVQKMIAKIAGENDSAKVLLAFYLDLC